MNLLLFYGSSDFWKIKGGRRVKICLKNGDNPYIGVSLVMYGFCSNNATFLTSVSFMFIFVSTPFDNWDSYYFESNLSLVLLIKVFLRKKACNVVLQSSKLEDIILPQDFIFAFTPHFIGMILPKKILWKVVECVYRKGFQNLRILWYLF